MERKYLIREPIQDWEVQTDMEPETEADNKMEEENNSDSNAPPDEESIRREKLPQDQWIMRKLR